MAWGRKEAPRPSTLSQVFPLLVVLVVLAGIAFVGYHVWDAASKVNKQARDKMARKNVVFTKDGMRVGVKHVEQERYVDATQSWVVKAWNLSNPTPSTVSKRQ